MTFKNILIFGGGFVGRATANLMLTNRIHTKIVDIDSSKLDSISQEFIQYSEFFNVVKFEDVLSSNLDRYDLIYLCLPTDLDQSGVLDISKIDNTLKCLDAVLNRDVPIVIKSTLNVGSTRELQKSYRNLIFSPEFLREGFEFHDVKNPERIVIGFDSLEHVDSRYVEFEKSLRSHLKDIDVIVSNFEEAELIKLASNSYLAARIAFFNEISMYALMHNLDHRKVIKGITLDSRIGSTYANPSFGFGGYCLPKDSESLSNLFKQHGFDHDLISQIPTSNVHHISRIADIVEAKNVNAIGVYRTVAKSGSTNDKESSIVKVINELVNRNLDLKIYVYEPELTTTYQNTEKVVSLEELDQKSEVILTDRVSHELNSLSTEIFTLDINY